MDDWFEDDAHQGEAWDAPQLFETADHQYDPQTAACTQLAASVLRVACRDYLRGPKPGSPLLNEDYESARDFFAEYDDASEPMSFFWICHVLSPHRPKWLRWRILAGLGCCPAGLDRAD